VPAQYNIEAAAKAMLDAIHNQETCGEVMEVRNSITRLFVRSAGDNVPCPSMANLNKKGEKSYKIPHLLFLTTIS
jgi:hypothetical protein